jgi:hypothetical protein
MANPVFGHAADRATRDGDLKVVSFPSPTEVLIATKAGTFNLRLGQTLGKWTFMGATAAQQRYAVLEDFENQDGHIIYVDNNGKRLDFSKSAESFRVDGSRLFNGHKPSEIEANAKDILKEEILSGAGDPTYDRVANVFRPIQGPLAEIPHGMDDTTVGIAATPNTADKIFFFAGGETLSIKPKIFSPAIADIIKEGMTREGLVGGYLPAYRFVYPEPSGAWTELIAFAPFKIVNGNDRFQPVWYRVSRIENGALKWSRYFDSFPPFQAKSAIGDGVKDGEPFFTDFLSFHEKWDQILDRGMKVSLPDDRVANMARFTLIVSIMTRIGDYPKYGLPGENSYPGYGQSSHDGFPDTFTVQAAAMVEWGLLDEAGRYIDNYFSKFVRDDGSILYRGPETGQYGRMLAVLAQYANAGGDSTILLRNRAHIEAVGNLLLTLRANAEKLPRENPAYGLLAGRSEADSVFVSDPSRYNQPYFGNSAEAIRGFHDLGLVWEQLGQANGDSGMTSLGRQLVREADGLRADLAASIAKSVLSVDGEKVLPSIAGVALPDDMAVKKDSNDPQAFGVRAFMEMLASGVLDRGTVDLIRQNLSSRHGSLLGMPGIHWGRGDFQDSFGGILSYDYGYSLVQTDDVREALLFLFGEMAHLYTRGTWIAGEERNPDTSSWSGYSVAAELTVPLMVRWLTIFEDPQVDALWLARGTPTAWLADGKTIGITGAPTRWGKVSYVIHSRMSRHQIDATVLLPAAGIKAATHLRLRTEPFLRMKSVKLNGRPWSKFDPVKQVVDLPAGVGGNIDIKVSY